MKVTLLPVNKKLKQVIRAHGASGWVILQNTDRLQARHNQPASMVSKNNYARWVTLDEFEMEND
jgi:hypothetical protein